MRFLIAPTNLSPLPPRPSPPSARRIRLVPGLRVLETLDTLKLAAKLDNGCVLADRASLDVYVQVDTSGEASKSGVPPAELGAFIAQVQTQCPRLRVTGLMTIGAPGDLSCFDRLVECAADVQALVAVPSARVGVGEGQEREHGQEQEGDSPLAPPPQLQLSMGMSGDFIEAVARGSTSVRVGSSIFGARSYPASV